MIVSGRFRGYNAVTVHQIQMYYSLRKIIYKSEIITTTTGNEDINPYILNIPVDAVVKNYPIITFPTTISFKFIVGYDGGFSRAGSA